MRTFWRARRPTKGLIAGIEMTRSLELPFAYERELTMLNITIEENGKTALLHCAGRIVRGDETALLCAALGQHGRNIALDLREVETIDAAGIGALVSLQAAGIYLRLMNPSKAIREVLRLTRLESLFEICSAALGGSIEPQRESPTERASAPFASPAFVPAT
jgi:anti-anti-sigma factor